MYYGNSRCLGFITSAAFIIAESTYFLLFSPVKQVDLIRAEDLNLINAILTK